MRVKGHEDKIVKNSYLGSANSSRPPPAHISGWEIKWMWRGYKGPEEAKLLYVDKGSFIDNESTLFVCIIQVEWPESHNCRPHIPATGSWDIIARSYTYLFIVIIILYMFFIVTIEITITCFIIINVAYFPSKSLA
jgi:hypothetical protein